MSRPSALPPSKYRVSSAAIVPPGVQLDAVTVSPELRVVLEDACSATMLVATSALVTLRLEPSTANPVLPPLPRWPARWPFHLCRALS